MYVRKLVSVVLFMVMCLSVFIVPTSALAQEEIISPSAVLMEPDTHKILFEKNAHELRACASITKVILTQLISDYNEKFLDFYCI